MPGYTNISKPTGAIYTNVSKPSGTGGAGGTILVGMATGLLMPLTYSTQHVISAGTAYTNISKPTGSSYNNILKPT